MDTHVCVKEVGVQCSLLLTPNTSIPLKHPSQSDTSQSDLGNRYGRRLGYLRVHTLARGYLIVSMTSVHSKGQSVNKVYHCRSDSSSQSTLLSSSFMAGYLVFESALLLLFSVCRFCLSHTVDVSKVINSSFLRVTQKCSNCRLKFVWDSQSFIGCVPAGNMLASAAILYAGALPTKAIRIFWILNCATITLRKFFHHQKRYLQPAISTIWEREQLSLISSLKEQEKKLALSGDGRADSPGHSAKFGSYTVVDI